MRLDDMDKWQMAGMKMHDVNMLSPANDQDGKARVEETAE